MPLLCARLRTYHLTTNYFKMEKVDPVRGKPRARMAHNKQNKTKNCQVSTSWVTIRKEGIDRVEAVAITSLLNKKKNDFGFHYFLVYPISSLFFFCDIGEIAGISEVKVCYRGWFFRKICSHGSNYLHGVYVFFN